MAFFKLSPFARRRFKRRITPIRRRRPTFRRRTMRFSGRNRRSTFKRRVLNFSTKKKMDSMLTAVVAPVTTSPPVVTPGAITIASTQGTEHFVFGATLRTFSGSLPAQNSQRTSTETFPVGLKERLRFAVTDGNTWYWRRICFTTYGSEVWNGTLGNAGATGFNQPPVAIISGSFHRAWLALGGATQNAEQLAIFAHLTTLVFRGIFNEDYTDYMTAPTNARAVKVFHDRVTKISSGNEEGAYKITARWHPMKKRLVYDDLEEGAAEASSLYSAPGRSSFGDYYVYDIIQPSDTTNGSEITFAADSTFYWHEK
jgi:hypothetical protein